MIITNKSSKMSCKINSKDENNSAVCCFNWSESKQNHYLSSIYFNFTSIPSSYGEKMSYIINHLFIHFLDGSKDERMYE